MTCDLRTTRPVRTGAGFDFHTTRAARCDPGCRDMRCHGSWNCRAVHHGDIRAVTLTAHVKCICISQSPAKPRACNGAHPRSHNPHLINRTASHATEPPCGRLTGHRQTSRHPARRARRAPGSDSHSWPCVRSQSAACGQCGSWRPSCAAPARTSSTGSTSSRRRA